MKRQFFLLKLEPENKLPRAVLNFSKMWIKSGKVIRGWSVGKSACFFTRFECALVFAFLSAHCLL